MNSSYVFNGLDFNCTYKQFVTNLAKDMGSPTMNALHAAVGISGEAGEVIDAVKKIWIYNKEPDSVYHKNIIEELGDLNFYMQYMQNVYNITDEQIIESNIEKLKKRYKKGYSDEAAIAREDKVEEIAVASIVEVKDTRYELQKAMDNIKGVHITFVSPNYIDAANFRYSNYYSDSDYTLASIPIKSHITIVIRGSAQWNSWYNNATKVPA